jgi:hypothetical protein
MPSRDSLKPNHPLPQGWRVNGSPPERINMSVFDKMMSEVPVKEVKTVKVKGTKEKRVCKAASGLLTDTERYNLWLYLDSVTQSALN